MYTSQIAIAMSSSTRNLRSNTSHCAGTKDSPYASILQQARQVRRNCPPRVGEMLRAVPPPPPGRLGAPCAMSSAIAQSLLSCAEFGETSTCPSCQSPSSCCSSAHSRRRKVAESTVIPKNPLQRALQFRPYTNKQEAEGASVTRHARAGLAQPRCT